VASLGRGPVEGVVRKIYPDAKGRVEGYELARVKDGDIIVSPMTTPDLVPAMGRAGGIITDHGGITCHAAVIGREMGKLVFVGTECASVVLVDGMRVRMQIEGDGDDMIGQVLKVEDTFR
jgi:pyruvate, water dikinase